MIVLIWMMTMIWVCKQMINKYKYIIILINNEYKRRFFTPNKELFNT